MERHSGLTELSVMVGCNKPDDDKFVVTNEC